VVFGHQDRLTFLVHSQLWLVPAGLIVLAAEPVNRDRLRPAQALGLRYAGLLLVYLSSTAGLFLTGLGRGVQLPIALALLSAAGELLGTCSACAPSCRRGDVLALRRLPRRGTPSSSSRTEAGRWLGMN
jgi:hypothetical protein